MKKLIYRDLEREQKIRTDIDAMIKLINQMLAVWQELGLTPTVEQFNNPEKTYMELTGQSLGKYNAWPPLPENLRQLYVFLRRNVTSGYDLFDEDWKVNDQKLEKCVNTGSVYAETEAQVEFANNCITYVALGQKISDGLSAMNLPSLRVPDCPFVFTGRIYPNLPILKLDTDVLRLLLTFITT